MNFLPRRQVGIKLSPNLNQFTIDFSNCKSMYLISLRKSLESNDGGTTRSYIIKTNLVALHMLRIGFAKMFNIECLVSFFFFF